MRIRLIPLLAVLLLASGAAHGEPSPKTAPTQEAKTAPVYPWEPTSTDRLDARFAAPVGFTRADVAPRSFGAFLRSLPVEPAGTPVVDYRGRVVLAGDDPNLAAVVDIDVGKADLQQCADAVLRMDAEWRYGRGDHHMAYPTASGTVVAYDRYLAGERAVASGNRLSLQPTAGRMTDGHRALRSYLDEVFTWANTTSLAREGAEIPYSEVRPGDYFVSSNGRVGHAVLVLDVAHDTAGHVALLLGQSYMPAQSFQVLRPSGRSAWFIGRSDADEVETPFWPPFSTASSLHRLPAAP
jgi:hypothetical protein